MEDFSLQSPHLDFLLTVNEIAVECTKAQFSCMLQRYKQKNKFTNAQVAHKLHLSKRAFSKLLDGDASLSLDMIGAICDLVGADFRVDVNFTGQ